MELLCPLLVILFVVAWLSWSFNTMASAVNQVSAALKRRSGEAPQQADTKGGERRRAWNEFWEKLGNKKLW